MKPMAIKPLISLYKNNHSKNLFIVTFASEKGGVGKTTIATNLAVYLKALYEDLPVTIVSFDNHFTVDRMFAIVPPSMHAVGGLFANHSANELSVLGQYGVQFIPSERHLRTPPHPPCWLTNRIHDAAFEGVLILDTKPVLDWFTEAALLSSDLVISPVKDRSALINIATLQNVLCRVGKDKAMWLLPSLVDLRAKFENEHSVYEYLVENARNQNYQVLDFYISKSPKVESLASSSSLKIHSVLNKARNTAVHGQLKLLADFVYKHCQEHLERPKTDCYQGKQQIRSLKTAKPNYLE